MIFITGATGLVGSHLTHYLVTNGYKVKLLIRNKQKISQIANTFSYYNDKLSVYKHQITYCEGDITDIYSLKEALENNTDYVLHCAGLISFDKRDKKQLLNINKEGTANMVNASLEAGVKKFVYVSSIATLGNSSTNEINENNQAFEYNSLSEYGNSKHYGELEVWRGVEEGMKAVIVNPTVIIGPGQWKQGSPRLFKAIYSGMPFFTTGTTGFVDVRDVVRVMSELMFSGIENQQFILNNENLNYQRFFNIVADNLNVRKPRFKAQPWMMYTFAEIISFFSKLIGKSNQINKATVSTVFSEINYDNSKIQKVLKTQLQGIEDAIAFTAKCFIKDHQS